MAKIICRIQHQKNNKARKNRDKDGKALYKLMSNTVEGKTMENRTDERLVSKEKD